MDTDARDEQAVYLSPGLGLLLVLIIAAVAGYTLGTIVVIP